MVTRYHSFLLRFWTSETSEELSWRFSIENPETGDKRNFASLGDLMDFIEILTEAPSAFREDTEGEFFS